MDLNTSMTIAVGLGLGIAIHFYLKAKKSREEKKDADALDAVGKRLEKPIRRPQPKVNSKNSSYPSAGRVNSRKSGGSRTVRYRDDYDTNDLVGNVLVGTAILDSIEPETKTYSGGSESSSDSGINTSSFDSGDSDSSCD